MLKKSLRLLAVPAIIAAGTAGLSAQMAPANVEVLSVKGEVEAIDEFGNEGELRRGRALGTGVEISTGRNGVVKLAFANGIRLAVEEGTRVRLTKFALVRNDATRESDFHLLSTDKEPSFSSTEIVVVQGSVLMEIPPLGIPVSSFLLNTNYHRAVVQEPKDAAARALLKIPTVLRFEQGLDFGRLSVFKGIIHSAPNHLGLGPPSDVSGGASVLYRFGQSPHYEQATLDRKAMEFINAEETPETPFDPDSPGPLPAPLPPELPEGPPDVSLVYPPEGPSKNVHRNGMR
ncbi:MAG: hypothetical protein LBG65_01930 [Puniceicoccales bacterium]|jgi:hypothetical protein|nr:hypothetical protein [Puniceicoccales bacterium]